MSANATTETLSREEIINYRKDNRKKFLKIEPTKRIGFNCSAISNIVADI